MKKLSKEIAEQKLREADVLGSSPIWDLESIDKEILEQRPFGNETIVSLQKFDRTNIVRWHRCSSVGLWIAVGDYFEL